MTTPTPATDYDRVVARLSALSIADGDHWIAMDPDASLIELRDLRDHWINVLHRDNRPGNPANLALMTWTGMNVKTRLPFVFETLGIAG